MFSKADVLVRAFHSRGLKKKSFHSSSAGQGGRWERGLAAAAASVLHGAGVGGLMPPPQEARLRRQRTEEGDRGDRPCPPPFLFWNMQSTCSRGS